VIYLTPLFNCFGYVMSYGTQFLMMENKDVEQSNQYLQHLNPRHHEYDAGVLTT
jgi:hypothetical protein